MSVRSRSLPTIATLAVAAMLSPVLVAAVDLSGPRATFETFLSSTIEYKKGDTARLDDAVACLDLSGIAEPLHGDAGPRLVRDLKTFLDKWEYIDLQGIPNEVEGDRWTYLRLTQGEVSLGLQEDGRWLFTTETLASLPDLLEMVADRDFVEGIEGGGGAPATYGDWIRARVPKDAQRQVFLLELWQWVGLLAIAFIGAIVDRVVRWLLGIWLRRFWKGRRQTLQRETEASFEKPIGILAMTLVWAILVRLLDLPLDVLSALVVAVRFVMAAAGVWAAYRFVDVLAAYLSSLAARTETTLDDILIPLARRALKVVIIAFGIVFVAQSMNVNVSSLLAGLGIGGIAFALAAKDTVQNLFGSVTVLADRPFQIGDWVVIGDLEGTVEELGLRSTRIRTFYNSLITVPNSRLTSAAVDNLGERRHRRVKCMISIQYDTSPDRIEAFCEGIRELIRRHPYTRKDYYMVYLNEFAASALNVLLYAFFDTPDWATELRERHRLFVDIVRLAARLDVEFAFPTRTLHLASAPPGLGSQPEAAEPVQGATESIAEDPSWKPEVHEEAIVLGRKEAEAIVDGVWGEQPQPPVDFSRPDRIRPGEKQGD
jgi:MscS family membrane protein